MAGEKMCSTQVLNGLLMAIVDRSTVFKICVLTSNSPLTVGAASSNSTEYLAGSTVAIPTTAYFTMGACSNNQYMTIGACSSDTVINTGIAANVIIVNATCTEVMYATTCTTQTLTAANKVNIGSWTITVNQPT